MLAMGRALMSRPKVPARRTLDGPVAHHGHKIFRGGADVYAQGVTVLLVEQNASRALAIADPALRHGIGCRDHERRRQGHASTIRVFARPTLGR